MILFGVISALAFAFVGGVAAWLLARRPRAAQANVALLVGALWLTSLATTWTFAGRLGAVAPDAVSGAALAWPVAPRSPLVPAPAEPSTTAAALQVGPVQALVGGLETRLAANPDDANGWALLAQSYAYTANEAAVERAMRRAIELGVDETSLRERVERAKRSAHSGEWANPTPTSGRR